MKNIGESREVQIGDQRSAFSLQPQADSRKLNAESIFSKLKTKNWKLATIFLTFAVFLIAALPA